MAISFMRMLRLGPLVSFKGSPTVSPITAAFINLIIIFNNYIINLLKYKLYGYNENLFTLCSSVPFIFWLS